MSVNIIQSSGCFSEVLVLVLELVVVYSDGQSTQGPVCVFHFSLRRYNTVAFK